MNGVHTRCGLWLLVFSIACGPRGGDAGGRTETASSHASLEAMGVPCRDRLEDVTRPLGGRAPGRGGLVACVPEVVYGRDEATRRAIRSGYSGPPLERSIVSYRIAYGTERLDGQPGVSTARVYLPHSLPEGRVPIAVVAHGTMGLADACAPSRQDGVPIEMMALPLVDAGFAVIATDYAGLGNGGGETFQGWGVARDEAHSVLDAARALEALLPSGRRGPIALVGYSQGGGAVLAAQALARTYGAGLEIVAVVAEAPAWLDASFYSRMIANPSLLVRGPKELLHAFVSTWFFAHAAVYDGVDRATGPFAPAVREGVREAMSERCILTLGNRLGAHARTIGDLYDPSFVASLDRCLDGDRCDDVGRAWRARIDADRLSFDSHGPPVLLLQGLRDGIITPAATRCTLQGLERDGVRVRICTDAEADHLELPGRSATFVSEYLRARLDGAHEPACTASLPACESD